MLRVYLDDSGDQDSPGVFVLAGYIGAADQWDECQRNWDEILAAFNQRHALKIRYLHMTDLIAGRGDFDGVDKLVRASLLTKLCALAKVRSRIGVGSIVMIEDYLKVLGSPDPKIRPPAIPAPLSVCADSVISVARTWAIEHGYNEPLAYVIERGSKYRGQLLDGFDRALRGRDGPTLGLDSICQGPKELAGLQLADLHAWTLAAKCKGLLEHRGRSHGGPRIPDVFRLQLNQFVDTHPHKHWIWDRTKLRDCTEEYMRFLLDQKSRGGGM